VFDQFLDAREAARRLKVHPETVKRLIREEQLPARKFGNKWLIERDVLEQFASTYRAGPGVKRQLF
jgi:excisionase family DNA binding protein